MRYAPAVPFPPYAYQPGQTPHPHTHPKGHSYGAPEPTATPLIEHNWRNNEVYLYGVDLFNYEYYWEAHEAWEGLWKLEESTAHRALFLQGLIQVAAMCIKRRAGNARGVEKLRSKAVLKLRLLCAETPYMGIDLGALCQTLTQRPLGSISFSFVLTPWPQ
ncbi:MAG: DUF309 domain-containing protein [Candidatus Latescibacterota bacterium]|jgi:hypothetical protein|tara:strand:+ start:294 stop:776 length:483 start_codon:yes stop_codon:yes gene_type:complete